MGNSSLPVWLLRMKVEGTRLTPTERRVLRLIAFGETPIEAAQKLGISPVTMRKHMKVIRARLGARTTPHAVAIAVSLDLI